MSEPSPAPNRLSEVLRLTSALVESVLDDQATGRPVPDQQGRALMQAADLLRDHDVKWPPMLEQALHGLSGGPGRKATPAGKRPAAGDEFGSAFEEIARALNSMRGGRGRI